jgi:hypothetical protein
MTKYGISFKDAADAINGRYSKSKQTAEQPA